MNPDKIRCEMSLVYEKYGDWVGQNIMLEDGSWLKENGSYTKVEQVVQVTMSMFNNSLKGLRVIDLGCLTGYYSFALIQNGAEYAVGVDANNKNIIKANKLRNLLVMDNLKFIQYDLRQGLPPEIKHEKFDVVLVAGLLYHLDLDYGVRILEEASNACSKFLYLSTTTTDKNDYQIEYKNNKYYGTRIREDKWKEEALPIKNKECWMGLDHNSVLFNEKSVYDMLIEFGFKTILEIKHPPKLKKDPRLTLAAIK